jgi:hypothetical protein
VGVIFWLSIVPAQSIPNIAALSFLTDKGIHFLIFLYLSFLGLISKFNIPSLILLATIFCFGLLIEVIHFYHPIDILKLQILLQTQWASYWLIIFLKKD